MLNPKLNEQFFGAASIQRWNDYPCMVELAVLDKQAHKFINGVLDKVATEIRPFESQANRK